jgi:hypothetical protein
MAFNRIKIVLLAGASLLISSCRNDDVTSQPQPQPQPAPLKVSRLIFTGTANTGGDVKVTLNDPKLELVLDGNSNYSGQSDVCLLFPCYPPRFSLISVEMVDLNYYGDSVSITCAESDSSRIPLEWRGSVGESLYENSNGIMYAWDNVGHYYEQDTNEVLTEAVIPDYSAFAVLGTGYVFAIECTGSDGSDYRVSFYDSSTDQAEHSHSITTTFSVEKGTVEGIIRVHRIGDGYHPYMDILL